MLKNKGETFELKNILIVTQFFPPSNAIASRRFGEMVPYLESFGYRPWVVTMHSEGPLFQPIPEERVFCFSRLPGGKIGLENWSNDQPIYRLAEALGFRTLSVGKGSSDWARAVEISKEEIRAKVGPLSCIIGSYGPSSAFAMAKSLSKYFKVPWVADFRDLGAWREDRRNFFVKTYDRRLEKKLVKSALGFTTVSETLRSLLMKRYQKPAEVIYNGFDFALEKPVESVITMPLRLELPYLYYAGQLYAHQMPSVELLLKTATTIPTSRIIFRILGPRYLERRVFQLVERYKLSSQVTILPPCEPHIVNQEADRSMANLVFENLSTDDEWSKGTITGKLLRLLPRRPPVMVVARPDSDIAEIFSATHRGRICHSEADIYRLYHEVIDQPHLFKGSSESVEFYSKKEQARRLCAFLDRILSYNSETNRAESSPLLVDAPQRGVQI